MIKISIIGLIAIIGVLTGCATQTRIWKNSQLVTPSKNTYSMGEFEDANLGKDRYAFPGATRVVSGALETALLQSGYKIVGLGEGNAIITGTVTAYYQGEFIGRYTTVGFECKATNSKTGEILWKASRSKTTQWVYNYDPFKLSSEVAKDLVQDLSR